MNNSVSKTFISNGQDFHSLLLIAHRGLNPGHGVVDISKDSWRPLAVGAFVPKGNGSNNFVFSILPFANQGAS